MMTDKAKLQQIQKKLAENEYFRHNVLKKLLDAIDETTGELEKELNIPQKEINDNYLFEVLTCELGYEIKVDEEYNPFYERFCYKIKLRR